MIVQFTRMAPIKWRVGLWGVIGCGIYSGVGCRESRGLLGFLDAEHVIVQFTRMAPTNGV